MTSNPEVRPLNTQLKFGIRQAIRSSLGGYLATPVIALYLNLALEHDPYLPYAWMALMYATLAARNYWLRQALHPAPGGAGSEPMRILSITSLGLACVMGALPAWLLPALSQYHGLFFTSVLCIWLSAGMASLGVLPRLFMAYAGLVVLGLAVGWLRSGDELALPLTGLMAFYLAVLASFSRNFARMVAAGIRIRLTNERLVKELQLANQAKARFILTASHDLKQPLHALSLLSSAISHGRTLEQMQAAAHGIRQSVHALVQLLSAVLDLSRMDAQAVQPRLSPVFVPELIARLSQEYAVLCQDKGLRWQSQQLPVTLRTDPAMLERLLRNLLDNALKHGGQGPVGIGMSLGSHLVITVTDHGPGIPAAEREHIFEEFYRLPQSRHATGLGLGLSIVRRLVHLLGYRLSVEHADPQHQSGTQFRLEIPLSHVLDEAAAPHQPAHPLDELNADLSGLSVLVIDDDEAIVQATLLLLRQWGCQAWGAQGLQSLLEDPAAAGFRPDVALIDNDPESPHDALAVAEAVAARWPDTGILLVTGQAEAAALSRLRQSGLPLLEKPVAPQELHEVLAMFHHLS